MIEMAATNALEMINRTLDLYKMEKGEYQPVLQAFNLGELLAKVARADKAGGSGLGTYSIRLMAEVQGGQVAMETGNERTRLTVTLPAP